MSGRTVGPHPCRSGENHEESAMKNNGVIHPDLVRLLAQLGHGDELLICDAGFPIPPEVERIDLGYRLGSPPFGDVVESIVADITSSRRSLRKIRCACSANARRCSVPTLTRTSISPEMSLGSGSLSMAAANSVASSRMRPARGQRRRW